jgi:hypothetical protein
MPIPKICQAEKNMPVQQRPARLICPPRPGCKNANGNRLQLSKLGDIAGLLRTHQTLKFAQVLTEAKGLGGMRIVLFVLCLTENFLDASLPEEVTSKLRQENSVRGFVEHALQQFCRPGDQAFQKELTRSDSNGSCEDVSATSCIRTV